MKTVRLDSLFDISYGTDNELNRLDLDNKGTNFVSRTRKNHGIVAKVKHLKEITPNPANSISLPLGSSTVLYAYLQEAPYYSGRDLAYLTPLIPMTTQELIYYCLCLRQNRYRYNYGRQANISIRELQIPDYNNLPDWVNKYEITDISHYEKSVADKHIPNPNLDKWKKFTIENIFDTIESGKVNNASALEKGEDIWYVGAKKNDNGLIKKVKLNQSLVTKGNCITMIADGQGSVGRANYMDQDFIGTVNIYAGYSTLLNKYSSLFIVAVLNANRFRYNFGRKWRGKRLLKSEILLPALLDNKGVPILSDDMKFILDYAYMENYIKSLPYSIGI